MTESAARDTERLFADRRRVVWLAGRRPRLGSPLFEGLIGLRWVAVLGMLATTLVARRFVPGLVLGPIVVVLTLTAASNFVWLRVPSGSTEESRVRRMVAQLGSDVVLLGGVLWFTGGIENPFAIFLTFQVALAALLCGGAAAVAIATLAVAVAALLTLAPHMPWDSATVSVLQLMRVGRLGAIVGVAAFLGVAGYLWRQRLEALRTESARNERFVVLGRLLGGMAHELNTPLATIVVASDELVELGRDADPDIANLSQVISHEAKRASNVISLLRGQVRDLAKAEPTDVSTVLAEAVSEEARRNEFEGTLRVHLPPGLVAWCIPTALRQIVANVIKNAIEAIGDRDEGTIDVTARAEGRRVVIEVCDNGCGIRPEDLPHLGEPFVTTKEQSGGTGLGLYVSSLLADRMKAQMQVEGHVDWGTRVILSLRLADGAMQRPPDSGREAESFERVPDA
jgi:two-component system sensor histidine kinase RegB